MIGSLGHYEGSLGGSLSSPPASRLAVTTIVQIDAGITRARRLSWGHTAHLIAHFPKLLLNYLSMLLYRL